MITTIHKNLHNGLWAITQSGKVVGYCTGAILLSPSIKEDAKKALFSRTPGNKRTVHLWVRGELSRVVGFESLKGREVKLSGLTRMPHVMKPATYNPKRGDCGFLVDGEIWTEGDVALFDNLGMSVG